MEMMFIRMATRHTDIIIQSAAPVDCWVTGGSGLLLLPLGSFSLPLGLPVVVLVGFLQDAVLQDARGRSNSFKFPPFILDSFSYCGLMNTQVLRNAFQPFPALCITIMCLLRSCKG
ncbi:hypothetical protein AMELA_G00164420 [Ameiurus melas]|uniref:Uncharacterized protein n=1 Tax=Ameiurus melas TaxID=219545 RepID=A0A7J6AFJ9_AMEME|nr:hypothetical protein AMELA_G00164420 [Ameiurus melas]